MKTFKDSKNREWQIAVNVSSIKRVRDVAAVDLMKIAEGDGKVIGSILADPVMLVDVLYAACQPQAEKQQINREDFDAGLTGDVLRDALDALTGDLADFFPKGRREVMKSAMAKIQEADSLMVQTAQQMLQTIDVQSLLPSAGASPTNSPDSSESTPIPSPSES